ncbi:hypothetical protein [Ponticoccus litoralis]|uniref:Uncharacterized protein n=1 Tax=Ponticoccus litoralis TaxID=422297 RepID=A0AAW9SMX4_9RHOB
MAPIPVPVLTKGLRMAPLSGMGRLIQTRALQMRMSPPGTRQRMAQRMTGVRTR